MAAAAKKLVRNVHLIDPKSGEPVVFGPESESVPAWARDAISNPAAWDGGKDKKDDAASE